MQTLFSRGLARLKKLLLIALCLVVVIVFRLGLYITQYSKLRRIIPEPSARQGDDYHLRRIVRSITIAAKFVPQATCLTQALSTQFVAALAGIPCQIRVGVAQNADGKFAAHAWVVNQGRVVIGGDGEDLLRFNTIATLGKDTR